MLQGINEHAHVKTITQCKSRTIQQFILLNNSFIFIYSASPVPPIRNDIDKCNSASGNGCLSVRLSVCLSRFVWAGLATGKGTTLPVGKAAARFPQQPNALSFSSRRISWPPHCLPPPLHDPLSRPLRRHRIYLGVIGSRRSSELYHFQAALLCGSASKGARVGTDITM